MNPFKILELDNTASPSDVKKQYKQLLRVHHPDHGGTVNNFIELKEAYDKAMKISKATKCTECNGFGNTQKLKGFKVLEIICPKCQGSGKQYKEGK